MKGIPWHIFPTAISSCPSALSPGMRARPKPRMPGSGSEVLLQKFSDETKNRGACTRLKNLALLEDTLILNPFYSKPVS